jgi:hypothetical protein
MPSQLDEYRFWDTKLADAHHNMLDTIQASAGKWQAAIATFLGVYATVGFVLTPDKLATLPVRGPAEIGLLTAYAAAGALGLVAVIMANLASQGIPQVRNETLGSEDYYQLVKKRAEDAGAQLLWAMKMAAIAGILAVAGSVYLLVAGVISANHPMATVVTPQSAYCGELLNPHGTLELSLPTGTIMSIPGGSTITSVSSCPG